MFKIYDNTLKCASKKSLFYGPIIPYTSLSLLTNNRNLDTWSLKMNKGKGRVKSQGQGVKWDWA